MDKWKTQYGFICDIQPNGGLANNLQDAPHNQSTRYGNYGQLTRSAHENKRVYTLLLRDVHDLKSNSCFGSELIVVPKYKC
jgi:hypothetical protein